MHIQSRPDPSVPGCCCSMPKGAKVVGIIEIALSVLALLVGIYGTAQGEYSNIATIVMAAISIICAVFLIKGASRRRASLFLPYMIWKPIVLIIQLALIIYIGVGTTRNWREEKQRRNWTEDERKSVERIFIATMVIVLGFVILFWLIGVVLLYVVIKCYQHLKKEEKLAGSGRVQQAVAYGPNGQPQGVTVVHGAPRGSHDQRAQPGQGYVNQSMAPSDPYYGK